MKAPIVSEPSTRQRCPAVARCSTWYRRTTPTGELAKNLERRGEGIDSIAYFVENLDDTVAYLSERGVELVNRHDYYGSKVTFIHPKVNSGVMVELIQQMSD